MSLNLTSFFHLLYRLVDICLGFEPWNSDVEHKYCFSQNRVPTARTRNIPTLAFKMTPIDPCKMTKRVKTNKIPVLAYVVPLQLLESFPCHVYDVSNQESFEVSQLLCNSDSSKKNSVPYFFQVLFEFPPVSSVFEFDL